jgi:hypothetical protein
MFTDDEDFNGRGKAAQGQNYPPDFITWPEDRKNAFFAGAAQEYREKRSNRNGHAGQIKADAVPWVPSLTCLSDIKPEPSRGFGGDGWREARCTLSPGSPGSAKARSR